MKKITMTEFRQGLAGFIKQAAAGKTILVCLKDNRRVAVISEDEWHGLIKTILAATRRARAKNHGPHASGKERGAE
jgi:PHD/YefM family antitoxin component YafN of YafNO toxin-antitoxin module